MLRNIKKLISVILLISFIFTFCGGTFAANNSDTSANTLSSASSASKTDNSQYPQKISASDKLVNLPESVINDGAHPGKKAEAVQEPGFNVKIEQNELNKNVLPDTYASGTNYLTSSFTGQYTNVNEQSNTTINVNGVNEPACLLNYNSIVSGSVQSSDKDDYYLFPINSKGKLILELNNVSTGADLLIRLTAVNWGGRYYTSDSTNNNAYISTIITDPTQQYYVVNLKGSGFSASNVSYKLKITFMPEDFVNSYDSQEMNNNDSFSGAKLINRAYGGENILFDSQAATIDFKGDYDCYKLNLDSGYKFTSILKSPSSGSPYWFVLLDSQYNQVNTNIFITNDSNGKQCYEMLYKVVSSGQYYLVVMAGESKYASAFDKYILDFFCTSGNESFEYNNSVNNFNESFSYSTYISTGTKYSCKLDTLYDVDCYKINAPTEGKISVSLDKKGYSQDFILLVKDLNGDVYQYDYSGSDYTFDVSSAGTYEIAVLRKNMQNTSTLQYDMLVGFAEKYDWYYTEVSNDNGDLLKVYLSDIGEKGSRSDGVTAIIASGGQTLGMTYTLNNGTWQSGTYASLPDSGGIAAASPETITAGAVLPKIFKIKFDEFKQNVVKKLLEQIGLSTFDLEPEETDMILSGVAAGLDDNYLFGLLQRFHRIETNYDDYYFVSAKILVDGASTVFWAGLTADAAANAAAAFAAAATTAAAGGLCAATGVGAPAGAALEAGAIASVVDGAICSVVSVVAASAAIKSKGFLEASTGYKNSLPENNAGNFREHLRQHAGDPPSSMAEPQAHHVLPQTFKNYFKSRGVDIHEPRYGSWVAKKDHLNFTYEYNLDWKNFRDANMQATISQIEGFARILAQKYGFSVHF